MQIATEEKSVRRQIVVTHVECTKLGVAPMNRYLALCAVSSLFKFLETSMSLRFASESLKFEWSPLEGQPLTVLPMSLSILILI